MPLLEFQVDALYQQYGKTENRALFEEILNIINEELEPTWAVFYSECEQTRLAHVAEWLIIEELLDEALNSGNIFNPQLFTKKCSLISRRFKANGLQALYLNENNLGIKEKAIKGSLTPFEWLTDLDLERMLALMDLQNQVHILPLDAQSIGTTLDFIKKKPENQASLEPYDAYFLLNKGSSLKSQGSHWVFAHFRIDPQHESVHCDLKDSLSLGEESRLNYEKVLEETLSFEEKNENNEVVFSAFPNWQHSTTIEGDGIQTEEYPCGYYALHYFLQSLNKEGLSEEARRYVELPLNALDLVKCFYEIQLQNIVIDPSFYEKLNHRQKKQFIQENNVPWYVFHKNEQPEEVFQEALPGEMQALLNTLDAHTQTLTLPQDENATAEQYESLFIAIHARLCSLNKTMQLFEIQGSSLSTLDGLDAFSCLQLGFRAQKLRIIFDGTQGKTFFEKLNYLLPKLNGEHLQYLELECSDDVSEVDIEAFVSFVEEQNIRLPISLPRRLQHTLFQRRLDEAQLKYQKNQKMALMKGEKFSVIEKKVTNVAHHPKRQRNKAEDPSEISVDIELQAEIAIDEEMTVSFSEKKTEGTLSETSHICDVEKFTTHFMNGTKIPIDHPARITTLTTLKTYWSTWLGSNPDVVGMTSDAADFLMLHNESFQYGLHLDNEAFLPEGLGFVEDLEDPSFKILHYDRDFFNKDKHKVAQILSNMEKPLSMTRDMCRQILDRWEGEEAHFISEIFDILPYDENIEAIIKNHLIVLLSMDLETLHFLFNRSSKDILYFLNNRKAISLRDKGDVMSCFAISESLIEKNFEWMNNEALYQGMDNEIAPKKALQLLMTETNYQRLENLEPFWGGSYNAFLEVFVTYGEDGIEYLLPFLDDNENSEDSFASFLYAYPFLWLSIIENKKAASLSKMWDGFRLSGGKFYFLKSLLQNHFENVKNDTDLQDLFLMFATFLQEIDEYGVTFDEHYSFENIKNMPVALGRMLSLLQYAREEDRQEQWKYIASIPLDEKGALYKVTRESYRFVMPKKLYAGDDALSKYREKWFFDLSKLDERRSLLISTYRSIDNAIFSSNFSDEIKTKLYCVVFKILEKNDKDDEGALKSFNTIFSALVNLKVPKVPFIDVKSECINNVLDLCMDWKVFPSDDIFIRLIELLNNILENYGLLELKKETDVLLEKGETLQQIVRDHDASVYDGMKCYKENEYHFSRDSEPLFYRHIDTANKLLTQKSVGDPVVQAALIALISQFNLHLLKDEEIDNLLDNIKAFVDKAVNDQTYRRLTRTFEILKDLSNNEGLNYLKLISLLERVLEYPTYKDLIKDWNFAPFSEEKELEEKTLYFSFNAKKPCIEMYAKASKGIVLYESPISESKAEDAKNLLENDADYYDVNDEKYKALIPMVLDFERRFWSNHLISEEIEDKWGSFFEPDYFSKKIAIEIPPTILNYLKNNFSKNSQKVIKKNLLNRLNSLEDHQKEALLKKLLNASCFIPKKSRDEWLLKFCETVVNFNLSLEGLDKILNIFLDEGASACNHFESFVDKVTDVQNKTGKNIDNFEEKSIIWLCEALPLLKQNNATKNKTFYWNALAMAFDAIINLEGHLENTRVIREKEDEKWNDLIGHLKTDLLQVKKEINHSYLASKEMEDALSLIPHDESIEDIKLHDENLLKKTKKLESKNIPELLALKDKINKGFDPHNRISKESASLIEIGIKSLRYSWRFLTDLFSTTKLYVFKKNDSRLENYKKNVGGYIFVTDTKQLFYIDQNGFLEKKLSTYDYILFHILNEEECARISDEEFHFNIGKSFIKNSIEKLVLPKMSECYEDYILTKINALKATLQAFQQHQKYSNVLMELIHEIHEAAGCYPENKEVVISWLKKCMKEEEIATAFENAKYFIDDWIRISSPETTYAICDHYGQDDESFMEFLTFLKNPSFQELGKSDKAECLRWLSELLNNHIPFSMDEIISLLPSIEKVRIIFKSPPYPTPHDILENILDDEDQLIAFKKHPCNREAANEFNLEYAISQAQKIRENSPEGDYSFLTDDALTRLKNAIDRARDSNFNNLIARLSRENAHLLSKEELVADTAELLYRTRGTNSNSFELNTTQYLSLLSLLSGAKVTAGIGTGEGKSRIMMVLAGCQYLRGFTVDFVTSNLMLASRDYLEYQSFLATLGAKVRLINASTPSSAYGDINFSDTPNLALFRNKAQVDGKMENVFHADPEKRSLLLDEADEIRFDSSDVRFNYSMEADKTLRHVPWVYASLIEFFLADFASKKDLYETDIDGCREAFLDFVYAKNPDWSKALSSFSNKQIETWQESAMTALSLKFRKDYVISPSEMVFSADKGPFRAALVQKLFKGREAPNVSMSFGVHQCLVAYLNFLKTHPDSMIYPDKELREELKKIQHDFYVDNEKQIVYSSSAKSFQDHYEKGEVKAVTGSPGSGKEALETSIFYQSRILHVPRHNGLRRVDHPAKLFEDDRALYEGIVHAIIKSRYNNQPVLLLTKDDAESYRLMTYLKEVFGDAPFLKLVDGQMSSKDEVEHAEKIAGQPGMVTVSTAISGRGSDIRLYGEAKNFGLNTMVTFLPGKRDLVQMRGRSGRFGLPGESHLFLSKAELKKEFQKETLNDGFYTAPEAYLHALQTQMEEKAQKMRFLKYSMNVWREKLAVDFFERLQEIPEEFRSTYIMKWCHFVRETDQISKQYELIIHASLKNEHEYQAPLTDFSQKIEFQWNILKKEIEAISTQFQFHFKDGFNDFSLLDGHENLMTDGEATRLRTSSYKHYHSEHDGRAVLYTHSFEQLRALFRGERRLFANFRAWREGVGILFPNFRALWNGQMTFRQWLFGGKKDEHFQAVFQAEAKPRSPHSYQKMLQEMSVPKKENMDLSNDDTEMSQPPSESFKNLFESASEDTSQELESWVDENGVEYEVHH